MHDKDLGNKSLELHLREAVIRTCQHIHFNPVRLHRSHCRRDAARLAALAYGDGPLTADSGDAPRTASSSSIGVGVVMRPAPVAVSQSSFRRIPKRTG
ncbi:hypothetical protein [Streptomyces sp. NPDC002403]